MPTKPPSQAPALRPEPGPESSAWARTPFDDVQADLIVRSSDGVQFRVFKIILSLASTVFADMFSVPLPTSPDLHDDDDSDEVVQVVPVSERSEDLDLFLRHLYPVPPPDTVPLKSVGILAEFARKYQVDALEESIMQYLTNYVDHDPVGVYAIAVQYEHKGIAADAARACLNLPFSRLQSPCLQYATVQHMSELFGYYAACAEAACAIASKRKWLYPCVRDGYYYSTRVGAQQTCQSCNTPDFINRVSGSQGKKIRPTMVVELLTSFRSHARTSSDCRSSYIGRVCAEGQRLPLVPAVYATVYAACQRDFWERNKGSSPACSLTQGCYSQSTIHAPSGSSTSSSCSNI